MDAVASGTDAVLALVACGVGGRGLLVGRPSERTVGLGVLLVGVAAVVGTLRFAGQQELADAHAGLSGLAACVGLPCIGAGWVTAVHAPERAEVVRRYVFGLLLVVAALVWWMPLARTVLGGAGMVAAGGAALGALPRSRPAAGLGALGAGLVLAVGLAIGTEGELLGFARVGWFHLGMAGAMAALGLGVERVPSRDDG